MYVLNFLLYQRLNYSFGPSTISCVNVIPQVSKSNRWWGGCASVVYSLGMGPKGHVLMRFHIIKKKKKKNQANFIPGRPLSENLNGII